MKETFYKPGRYHTVKVSYFYGMRNILLVISCLLSLNLWGQRKNALEVMSTSPSSKVSLLTCGPGDEAVSVYGHTAIRIKDEALGQDLVFNYGTYNFNTPGFYPKFIRGQLLYTLSASTFSNFLSNYQYENRFVVENEFLLDSLSKYRFIEAINVNYQPENRSYKYDFFYDNCSSRVWEVLKGVNENIVLRSEAENDALTFRDMINQYQQGMPWTDFGINIIIGSPADQLANEVEQLFLPDYLQAGLKKASLNGSAILGPDKWLFRVNRDKEKANNWPSYLFILLLLIELFFYLKKANHTLLKLYDGIYFFSLALVGSLLIFMWLGTDHLATHENYNLLWLNPLYFVLLLPGFDREKRYLTFALLILLTIGILGVLHILPQKLPFAALFIFGISALKLTRRYL